MLRTAIDQYENVQQQKIVLKHVYTTLRPFVFDSTLDRSRFYGLGFHENEYNTANALFRA